MSHSNHDESESSLFLDGSKGGGSSHSNGSEESGSEEDSSSEEGSSSGSGSGSGSYESESDSESEEERSKKDESGSVGTGGETAAADADNTASFLKSQPKHDEVMGKLASANDGNIDSILNELDDVEAEYDPPPVNAEREAPAAAAAASSSSSSADVSLLVLVSNQSLDRKVQQDQQHAMTVLESQNIPYATMDGADPDHREARNGLFEVSGLRAEYPQFFLVRGAERSFYGTMDTFTRAHEEGWLVQDLGVTAEPPTPRVVVPEKDDDDENGDVPFSSNADRILSRSARTEQSDGADTDHGDHAADGSPQVPIFTGGEVPTLDKDQEDMDDDDDDDIAETPPPAKTSPSLVQTVVQLWGNISSSTVSKTGSSNEPKDLPEELPHVKGIVVDMDTATAKEIQAKTEKEMMIQQMKEQGEQRRAERAARRQSQQEGVGGNYSDDQGGELEDRPMDMNHAPGKENSNHHDDGDGAEDPSEFEDERPREDNNDAKRGVKKSPWASLRNLFGRGKKKEQQEETANEGEKQDPLSLGQEQDDEEKEEDLFDRQEKGELSDNGQQKDPFSDHSSSHNKNGENEEEEQGQQDEPDIEQRQLALVVFEEPKNDGDEEQEAPQDKHDDSWNSQKEKENTQRDSSEVEPFLDEEQGLEQPQDQKSDDDKDESDPTAEQENQTPCSVYVATLLVGEVIGVLVGWLVWIR